MLCEQIKWFVYLCKNLGRQIQNYQNQNDHFLSKIQNKGNLIGSVLCVVVGNQFVLQEILPKKEGNSSRIYHDGEKK